MLLGVLVSSLYGWTSSPSKVFADTLSNTQISTQLFKNLKGSSIHEFTSVQQTKDGGYIAVGSSDSKDGDFTGLNKGFQDAIIVKFDAKGNKIWLKDIGGSGRFDNFTSVLQTKDGGYIAVGSSDSKDGDFTGLNKGDMDAIMVKFDANGNKLWIKDIGGKTADMGNLNSWFTPYDNDQFTSVQQTNDGGYIAVGTSNSKDGDFTGINKGRTDAIIVKFDTNGNKLWAKSIGGSQGESFHSVQQTKDGGYVAVGRTSSNDGDFTGFNTKRSDAIMVKFDTNGNKLWVKTFGGSQDDLLTSVQQTNDGGYIAVGDSNSDDGDLKGLINNFDDAIIVKFDANGNKLWVKSIGGGLFDLFKSVQQTKDGGYIAVGSSNSDDGDFTGINGHYYTYAIIVKYDANGNRLWIKNLFEINDESQNVSIHQTADGNYIIGGGSNIIKLSDNLEQSNSATNVAENSISQTDVNTANSAIAKLTDGRVKTDLKNRTAFVQKVVNAISLVAKEESSLNSYNAKLRTVNLSTQYNNLNSSLSQLNKQYQSDLKIINNLGTTNKTALANKITELKNRLYVVNKTENSIQQIINEVKNPNGKYKNTTINIKGSKSTKSNLLTICNKYIKNNIGLKNLHFVAMNNSVATIDQNGVATLIKNGVMKFAIYNENGIVNIYVNFTK